MIRQIIAMGGGGFSMEPGNPLLDQYVLEQARRPNPRVCFLPHATDDAPRYALLFHRSFASFEARLSDLSLFTPPADLAGFLLEQDVIYVGGGNTKSMLALWREWGLDSILRAAYDSGVVLAGLSAGANCWFEQCSTDSIPGPYTMLPGLGFLSGSFCPHYDGEPLRRPSYLEMVGSGIMLPGYAAEDGSAIHMVNEVPFLCVSSRPSAVVYRVSPGSEVALSTQYLKP